MTSSILWRRLDRAGHESARFVFRDPQWQLDGAAVFLFDDVPCALEYAVVCDPQWRTLTTRVRGWIGAGPVAIEIASAAGRWSANGRDVPQVAGCVDIDLGFSPSTNLLPIRRLNLEVGQSAAVRAAWLRFPELTLEILDQTYRRLSTDVYRYESRGGAFVADLRVNDHGFVTLYPGFFEQERDANSPQAAQSRVTL